MQYVPYLDDHRQGRRKSVDELADVIAKFWAHNGDDTTPTRTATDDALAHFILTNYRRRT